jgi:two-component system, OmpR family, sensor histidine kinase KdpD
VPGRLAWLDLGATERRPSLRETAGFAASGVVLATLLIYGLRELAPVVSTGVVYLVPVLLVAIGYGLVPALATAVASALAFNFFHLPPTGRLSIAAGGDWVALGVFLVTAVIASRLAGDARSRAVEAGRRRREALALADAARVLLRSATADDARNALAGALSGAFDLTAARVELRDVGPGEREEAVALIDGDRRLGTLLVPGTTRPGTLDSLWRLAPSLAALLGAARRREELEAEVLDTEALRRSDLLKTALLRSVSHDLRSPLTAIVAAAGGLRPQGDADAELAAVIREEAQRLTRLVDQLLDLSRLEAGSAQPHQEWVALDEVVATAAAGLPAGTDVRFDVHDDLPLVRADPAQLERAIANLIENAAHHGGGAPVDVSVRRAGHRLRVRVTDHGPGVPEAERERIFEPFWQGDGSKGSGLGLAIARGLVEANDGTLRAEAAAGGGASFVLDLAPRTRSAAGAENA